MDYRLIVLTHGYNTTLNETLASYAQWVRPLPVEAVLVYDGPTDFTPSIAGITEHWKYVTTRGPVGFCKTAARGWHEAAKESVDKVFWLENDFAFNRPVDLNVIGAVMDENPDVAQMALYRDACNPEEVAHGGYLTIPSRKDAYVPRATAIEVTERTGIDDYESYVEEMPWFEHTQYWTTNPSLIRRDVIAEFDWPVVERCEGKFGFTVKAGRPGTTFGVWGDGTEWVHHIGTRDGFGY